MYRVVLALILVALVALGSASTVSHDSVAQSSSPTPTSSRLPASAALNDFCLMEADTGTPTPGANWKETDVRPPGPDEAIITPAMEKATPDAIWRPLYLVEIRLPPGECMPAASEGNQKNGAIVMIVQQGIIEYRWEPAFLETSPEVLQGDLENKDEDPVPQGLVQTLYPGDWIAQDQDINFAYRNARGETNTGGETAIIVKAVWAVPNSESGGRGGSK